MLIYFRQKHRSYNLKEEGINMQQQINKVTKQITYLIGSAVVFSSGLLSMPKIANAADSYPCGNLTRNRAGELVQYCPLWRGNVPVYDTQLNVIGYLYQGGSVNWFYCQEATRVTYSYGNLRNNWWARTKADNLKIGWVNEVFFKGGGNYEPDARLRRC